MDPVWFIANSSWSIVAWVGPHSHPARDGSSSLSANWEIKSPLSQFLLSWLWMGWLEIALCQCRKWGEVSWAKL